MENGQFVKSFGYPNQGHWQDDEVSNKGFGITSLKTCPKNFPNDYEFIDYLRMKDYCAWIKVPDDFFAGDRWLQVSADIFKVGKPMMDIINSVVDDYE